MPHRSPKCVRQALTKLERKGLITVETGAPTVFQLYDLRHACATLMHASGVHPKIVSERLWHATTKLALDTYSQHVTPTMQDEATVAIAGIGYAPADDARPVN